MSGGEEEVCIIVVSLMWLWVDSNAPGMRYNQILLARLEATCARSEYINEDTECCDFQNG